MLPALWFSLVFLLLVLQLFLPLVHAHANSGVMAGWQGAGQLHLPGFETLSSQLPRIANQYSGQFFLWSADEGLLIVVDAAIKNPSLQAIVDFVQCILPPYLAAVSLVSIYWPVPHKPSLSGLTVTSQITFAHIPRAPPPTVVA